ncbi:hypothetical protein FV305_25775, partial [Escherichia coli]
RGSFQGETPGIFIVLSGFATSDLSVDFCDARQGGGAYGKTPATRPFYGSWPFAGLLLTCSCCFAMYGPDIRVDIDY